MGYHKFYANLASYFDLNQYLYKTQILLPIVIMILFH